MPRVHRRGKERLRDLSFDQLGELLWGPGAPDSIAFNPATIANRRSYFESPLVRRAAYFGHRDEVLADHNAGQRPWAWWQFEARERPRENVRKVEGYDWRGQLIYYDVNESEADCLRRMGQLQPWEEAQIAAWASINQAIERRS
jgi:hypothetical protein